MFSFPLQVHQVFLLVNGGSGLCSEGGYLLEQSKENNEWGFFFLVFFQSEAQSKEIPRFLRNF